jgi:hypothetical protein
MQTLRTIKIGSVAQVCLANTVSHMEAFVRLSFCVLWFTNTSHWRKLWSTKHRTGSGIGKSGGRQGSS